MSKRLSIRIAFLIIVLASTFALSELSFRMFDRLTAADGSQNMDEWIKKTSLEVEDHPVLGYRRKPNQVISEGTATDRYGMQNAKEAIGWDTVDVVGVGDSYMDLAHRLFYERFHSQGVKYHSLGVFGYGPGNYNVLMKEFGEELHPKVYIYSTYLGNDPGDIHRYEIWQSSGKGWFEYNGGYVFPIERQGLVWGWRLFVGRAKSFSRNLISRINPDSYGALRGLVKRDDAEVVFEYIVQAQEIADRQQAELLIVIVPRTEHHKPLLDPIAGKLINLCMERGIVCMDLDPSFGSASGRSGLFASDGHWNETGMEVAWKFIWDKKLSTLLSGKTTIQ